MSEVAPRRGDLIRVVGIDGTSALGIITNASATLNGGAIDVLWDTEDEPPTHETLTRRD